MFKGSASECFGSQYQHFPNPPQPSVADVICERPLKGAAPAVQITREAAKNQPEEMLSKVKQRTPDKTSVNVYLEPYFAVHQSTTACDAYILQINMIADKFFFEPVGASELDQL